MPNIAWRVIIVVVVGFFLGLIIPLLLSFLGIGVDESGIKLIRICLAFIAICYIFWGPDVTRPNIS